MNDAVLDLTPNARILTVIAEVDIQIHQCLAELIDNCFDELRKARDEDPVAEHRIDVELPAPGVVTSNSCVTVSDTGRGMDAVQMREALRAGASSNNPADNLGLFGMGFNIATARLGRLTEVRTGRKGDDHWSIATIDLDRMEQGDTFQVPLRREPKPTHVHGTTITVTRLSESIVTALSRQTAHRNIRSLLGHIYTYMLRTPEDFGVPGAEMFGGLGMSLYLNDTAVKPVVPCVWAPHRSVKYEGVDVPAIIEVNHPLADGFLCMGCGRWHGIPVSTCSECGRALVERRERSIRGWVGIQRYADRSDFGLTFLRNGRAICYNDRGLFDWENPEGSIETEYPIELGMGRIVGEIHIDHVPVNVRKSNFERASQAWADVVRLVRGEAPLRPQLAKRMGLTNTSPIARLFNAYRRAEGGLRYLVPGDGTKALHAQSRAWATEFKKGRSEYQDDTRWYEAAEQHDKIKNGEVVPEADTPDDDNVLEDMGLGDLVGPGGKEIPLGDGPSPAPTHEKPTPETRDDRLRRYTENARTLPEISGEVTIMGAKAELMAYEVLSTEIDEADGGRHWAIDGSGGTLRAFIHADHELIRVYGWSPADALLLCAHRSIANLYGYSKSQERVVASILASFPDRRMDAVSVRARGERLLEDLRSTFATVATENPVGTWNALAPGSKTAAETVAQSESPDTDWSQACIDGSFARFITPRGVIDVLRAHPDALLDGAVFTTRFAGWSEPNQQRAVDDLVPLLMDLESLTNLPASASMLAVRRLTLSADLLSELLVA